MLKKEVYGFVLNRLPYALVRAAFHLAPEEVASITHIDRRICEGVGLRWAFIGPFMTEELNSKRHLEGELRKDIDENEQLLAALGDFKRHDDTDIARAATGVQRIVDRVSHDEAVGWRDSMVLRLRALEASEPLLYRGSDG